MDQCQIDVTKKLKPVEENLQLHSEVMELHDEYEVIKRGYDLVKKIRGQEHELQILTEQYNQLTKKRKKDAP